ncbi:MAG: hypothetical protein N2246_01050 [Candidatus Sumerlaeia bacterium]|nr:hypothetical protein [Candidatus Sumerlaeia bacterium]
MYNPENKLIVCWFVVFAFLISVVSVEPVVAKDTSFGTIIFEYFRDRGNDFLDIFRLRISAARQAKGFGFHARVTTLAQIGGVYFEGEHVGLDRRAIGVWREERFSGGISALYFTDVNNDVVYGNRFTDLNDVWSQVKDRGIVRNNVYWDDGRHHPFSVGAEVQLGLLPGLDVGLYPTEAIDFLVGIFTLDPWDDDLMRIERLRPVPSQKKINAELVEEEVSQIEPPAPEPMIEETETTETLTLEQLLQSMKE